MRLSADRDVADVERTPLVVLTNRARRGSASADLGRPKDEGIEIGLRGGPTYPRYTMGGYAWVLVCVSAEGVEKGR